MIEEQIPISFLERFLDRYQDELTEEELSDSDRKKTIYLSGKVDALREVRREWLKHGRTN